jgi:hypothetical protein
MYRGVDGFQLSAASLPTGVGIPALGSFVISTDAPTSGFDIEFRYQLLDLQSNPLTRKDLIIALKAIERILLEQGLQQPAGTYLLPGLGI